MITTALFLPKRDARYVLWNKHSTHDRVQRRLPVGGRVEATDASVFEAAAREAQEESGLTPILVETVLLAVVENIHRDRVFMNRRMFWFLGMFHGLPRAYPEEGMLDPRAYTLREMPVGEMWEADARWLVPVLSAYERAPTTPVYYRRFTHERGVIVQESPLGPVPMLLPVFPF
ncbi:NUDIX domain-containing protein [Candidatus Uhrbacteria bacterium]|nr:NUDIX domain-containing protein [Candidatus Uhrbacteria bacterium]